MKIKIAYILLLLATLIIWDVMLINKFGFDAYWYVMIGSILLGRIAAYQAWNLCLEWQSNRASRTFQQELTGFFVDQGAKPHGIRITAHFQRGASVSNKP